MRLFKNRSVTCVDETICECWWINMICLRRLNFSLSSHASYLHFYRCVDFTCLMDKKMEMLKNSFSLFMFKKVVQWSSDASSNWCCLNKKIRVQITEFIIQNFFNPFAKRRTNCALGSGTHPGKMWALKTVDFPGT